jgi:plasmid stabilization system protein ParE
MKNISKVVWSEEAVENLKKIIQYLEENWTETEIKKFATKLEKQISIIRSQPDSFPKANHIDVRRSVLSKQTAIYYKVDQDSIRIVTVFDNRQNPEKLKL